MAQRVLPIPGHFDPAGVGRVWRVPYEDRFREAKAFAARHRIRPAGRDDRSVGLLLVDVQNTFCIPEYELFVAGRSGDGAVKDNERLCRFIYRNLQRITRICPTMDTHHPVQIFHSLFLIDDSGEHPAPFTPVSAEDIRNGRWRFNPAVADGLDVSPSYGQDFLRHYTERLAASGRYDLTVWPFHAMLGGIGHALVPAVEEAVFFHSVARAVNPVFEVKGDRPFTENYSVLHPEVLDDADGTPIAGANDDFVQTLLGFDAVFIAGQAKSHCVAWSVEDLLREIQRVDPALAGKVYLLADCTSPVVIPGVVDYTDAADDAFKRFADAGMHIVSSNTPMASWPDMPDMA
jgi:nicotinamidase-related amidase